MTTIGPSLHGAKSIHTPSYLSANWNPSALEKVRADDPLNRLVISACRQLTSTDILLVTLGYGSEQISEGDALLVARSLDEVAEAALRGPKGDGRIYIPPKSVLPPLPAAVESGLFSSELPIATKPSGGPLAGGVIGGVIAGAGSQALNPIDPGAMQTGPRIMVNGAIQAAQLVKKVEPIYPPLARQTKVSGVVKLRVLIDKDGRVYQLQVISGHPLLIQSAMDAVKQWEYKPTLLKGQRVMVETEIDVIFSLAQ
jgi:TonB family protein